MSDVQTPAPRRKRRTPTGSRPTTLGSSRSSSLSAAFMEIARHHHRQCGAAAYRRQSVGEQRRSDMGAHLLSRRQRHRPHHLRLARRSPRPQALFPDLHRHVHGVLVFLRHGRESVAAHRVSSGAGLLWRRAAAQSAIDHPRHLSAGKARRGLRRRGHRHHRRAGAGADARRLSSPTKRPGAGFSSSTCPSASSLFLSSPSWSKTRHGRRTRKSAAWTSSACR